MFKTQFYLCPQFFFPFRGLGGSIGGIFLFLSLTLSAAPELSRHYTYRYFTTRDGLAQMQVMCAFQDKDGFVWFGTKGGVSRWDGTSFKNYTAENGLPLGEIRNICEWGTRKLFFTARKMVVIEQNDSLTIYDLPKGMLFPSFYQFTLAIDKENIFVLGLVEESNENETSSRYNFIFNIDKKQFTQISNFNKKVRSISGNRLVCSDGIFIWTGKEFVRKLNLPFDVSHCVFDKKFEKGALQKPNTLQFQLFKLSNKSFVLMDTLRINESAHRCTWLPDGTFLSLNSVGHFFYPAKQVKLFEKMAFPNFSFVDKENNLWIGTENGLYNFFNLSIEEYRFNIGEPDNIWSIVEDNSGKMWFGSFGNGLITLNLQGKIQKNNFKNHFAASKQVAADQLYMGSTTYNNIVYISTALGVVSFNNSKLYGASNTPACLYTYFDKQTNQITYSGLDTISGKRGLYIGMNASKKFYPFENGFPVCISRDGNDVLRVGAFRGTGRLQGNKIVKDAYPREYEGVVSMSLDGKGRLWKATEKGIYVELRNGSEYRVSPLQLTGAYTSLAIYKNKYLIVGGRQGIGIIDIQNNKDFHNLSVVFIGHDAGFTGLESGQNGICVDSKGFVWLATSLNVLKFNPEDIVRNSVKRIPPLRVSGIYYSKNNNDWSSHFFSDGPISISPGNQFFRIEYVANSISAPKSLRFRYRLVGLSELWSKPYYSKSVSYTNLPYGTYHFEIQCSMDGEIWSRVITSPAIKILRPWYLSYPVLLLYLLGFIAFIIFVSLFSFKRKQQHKIEAFNRQKIENELQLNTLRSKVLPHFTKNVLSAIGHFAMTDKLKAGHYISVFSKFNGMTLANADKNYILLSEELDYIIQYLELEKMRFGDRFDYKLQMGSEVSPQILIPTMLLHTYCDNAIRHGLVNKEGTGLLIIEIQRKENGVLICVTDNGIGRKRAAELGTHGNRQGLKLIELQVEFYNRFNKQKMLQQIIDLVDSNGNAQGTKSTLFIPDGFTFKYG